MTFNFHKKNVNLFNVFGIVLLILYANFMQIKKSYNFFLVTL
jgi:hypothetical protein